MRSFSTARIRGLSDFQIGLYMKNLHQTMSFYTLIPDCSICMRDLPLKQSSMFCFSGVDSPLSWPGRHGDLQAQSWWCRRLQCHRFGPNTRLLLLSCSLLEHLRIQDSCPDQQLPALPAQTFAGLQAARWAVCWAP